MEKMLKDKICIITGSGRGIGRAAALKFAGEGAKVAVTDIDERHALQVAEEVVKNGGQAVPVAGDVTSGEFAEMLVAETVKAFGPDIDVIVNNAGYTWDGLINKMTDRQWQAMLDLHTTAPFRIIRAASPYMRDNAAREIKELGKAKCRKVINVSSVTGLDGNFGQVNYSSAKAAVVGLTKSLAREWGPYNVCVNCIAFGFIDTRLSQAKEAGEVIIRGEDRIALGIPGKIRNIALLLCPLGRPGTTGEAAASLLMLASPLADYISGQVIRVSGGY